MDKYNTAQTAPSPYLEQGLHHAAGDKGLATSIIAGQVVEEGEERCGKLVRVWLH